MVRTTKWESRRQASPQDPRRVDKDEYGEKNDRPTRDPHHQGRVSKAVIGVTHLRPPLNECPTVFSVAGRASNSMLFTRLARTARKAARMGDAPRVRGASSSVLIRVDFVAYARRLYRGGFVGRGHVL